MNVKSLNAKSSYALQNMVSDMNVNTISCHISLLVCEAYIEGKQHMAIFSNDAERQSTKPLEIVHSDVCGPYLWAVQGILSPSLIIFQ